MDHALNDLLYKGGKEPIDNIAPIAVATDKERREFYEVSKKLRFLSMELRALSNEIKRARKRREHFRERWKYRRELIQKGKLK